MERELQTAKATENEMSDYLRHIHAEIGKRLRDMKSLNEEAFNLLDHKLTQISIK